MEWFKARTWLWGQTRLSHLSEASVTPKLSQVSVVQQWPFFCTQRTDCFLKATDQGKAANELRTCSFVFWSHCSIKKSKIASSTFKLHLLLKWNAKKRHFQRQTCNNCQDKEGKELNPVNMQETTSWQGLKLQRENFTLVSSHLRLTRREYRKCKPCVLKCWGFAQEQAGIYYCLDWFIPFKQIRFL